MPTLLFIDTNIFLDFYRYVDQEEALSMLKHIDDNHDKIITGSQVEMEYKKNRQTTILGCLKDFKVVQGAAPPAFLSHAKAVGKIKKSREEIKSRVAALTRTATAVLENPAANDRIYQACQRLFRSPGDLNLSREKKLRFRIRSLARKRFILGYPPRKPGDTSMGDAINWEWIVHCASTYNSDVVIASRDGDYGVTHNGQQIINDWLSQEFKSRVNRRRTVRLTSKLSQALKMASISVTKKESAAEDEMISNQTKPGIRVDEDIQKWMDIWLKLRKSGIESER